MRFAISLACVAALLTSVARADDKPKEKEKEKAKDVPELIEILKNIDKEPDTAKKLKGEKYNFVVEIASYVSESHANKAKIDSPFNILLHLPRKYEKNDRIAVTATVKSISWEAKNKRILFDPVTVEEEISVTPPLFTANKFMEDYLRSDFYGKTSRMRDAYEGKSVRLSGTISGGSTSGPGNGNGTGPGTPGGPMGGPGGPGGNGGRGSGRSIGGAPMPPPGGGGAPGRVGGPGGGGPGAGPGGAPPAGPGPLPSDYYMLNQSFQSGTGQATLMLIVRFSDDKDGKPVTPTSGSNIKIEGTVESMFGTTIIVKDAKIIK